MSNREALRRRRHARVRRKITGTPQRPRLLVHRSNRNILAQIIDDVNGKTLVSASSLTPELSSQIAPSERGNVTAAEHVGRLVASRAKAAGITTVVFDRGGHAYHGRVAKLADAARAEGLEF
ncbi:MAG: 50S ribosomal protein L18 [Actinobacteria bacterium]|nr:50S ribosomal protein L18 [Actinomycetota bacterium]MCL5445674.1 50S ribosomal protein L18 [Actinomycetota bacterium]